MGGLPDPFVGVAQVARAASGAGGQAERAADVLDELRSLVPYDCAELSLWDPVGERHRLLANAGYARKMVDFFHGSAFQADIAGLGMRASGTPYRMRDVPDRAEVRSIAEVLEPAGFREGLSMCLRTSDGRYAGMLNLSTTEERHPTDVATAAIAALGPTLANVADATRSARTLVGLVAPGSEAVGLTADGQVAELPGIAAPDVLRAREVVAHACALPSTRGGAFVWPADDRGWHRIRVIPCGEDEGLRAIVTATPPSTLHDLTRRELEVLTLLARGCSNPEIGAALYISARTAGTYVERILEKLEASSRAAAAARAAAEGLLLPTVLAR